MGIFLTYRECNNLEKIDRKLQAIISVPTTWSDGQILTANALNGAFTTIYNDYDGNITDANISATAAIATSKISATFPSGSIVGTTDTQVLTNKTITGGILNKPTIDASIQNISTMAAQALDGSAANIFTRTLGGSETFTQSNFSTGQVFIVIVKQGSGTTYTIAWFSGVTWVTTGATAPIQTTVSNGFTTYGFICTGSNTFSGYLVGSN